MTENGSNEEVFNHLKKLNPDLQTHVEALWHTASSKFGFRREGVETPTLGGVAKLLQLKAVLIIGCESDVRLCECLKGKLLLFLI